MDESSSKFNSGDDDNVNANVDAEFQNASEVSSDSAIDMAAGSEPGEDPSATRLNAAQDSAGELEKLKSEHLYLRAEFDNYRRNAIRERAELSRYGYQHFASQILGVIDILDQALASEVNASNWQAFVEGVRMTRSEFQSVLEKFGIKSVPAEGLDFDPNQHEAIGSEPSDSVPPNKVLRVYKPAYQLHDKLLRPAQVIVASAPVLENQEN